MTMHMHNPFAADDDENLLGVLAPRKDEPASLLASALRRRGSENGAAHSPTGREIKTRSGLMIDVTRPDLFDPRDGDGMLADIAWSLSGIARYGGHSPNTVSVAAHSIRLVGEYKALASATPGDVASTVP